MSAFWFDTALLPGGWARSVRIVHDGGLIGAIEVGGAREVADEAGAIALPGLCNLHSHAFQRAMAGLAETRGPSDDDFWTWREVMYRFVDRLDPADVQAIAALAYAEMLESGFTRVGEFHYLHHDRDGRSYADPAEMAVAIAAAADESGIGLTLLPVFYAHAGFDGTAPSAGQRRFVNNLDSFAELLSQSRRAVAGTSDARVGVAPHSLRAVAPAELERLITLAPDDPIHIHVAEQAREVADCLAWSSRRPVEWLLDEARVDGRWCLVHATHMSPAETARLAASGAVAGLCPITEANLGDGLFPAGPYLAAGGRIGLGSDSNVLIDAAEELRLLEYGQRLERQGRNLLASEALASTGAALFAASGAGGSQAAGRREDRPGRGRAGRHRRSRSGPPLTGRPPGRRPPARRLDLRRPRRGGVVGLASRAKSGRGRPARCARGDRGALSPNPGPPPRLNQRPVAGRRDRGRRAR